MTKRLLTLLALLAFSISVTAAGADGVRVSGRVVDPISRFPGFSSRVVLTKGAEMREALLDRDGSFQFSMVPPGTYSLRVNPSPIFAKSIPIVVGDRDVLGIVVTFPQVFPLAGRIVVEDGGPPPRFSLQDSVDGDVPIELAFVASTDGTFKVGLPAGHHRLSVRGVPPGYALLSLTYGSADPRTIQIELPDRGDQVLVATFRLLRPGARVTVKGRVIGVGDVEMMTTTPSPVQISLGNTSQDFIAFMQPDGTFEFPRVLPGIYQAGIVSVNVVGVAPVTVLVSDEPVNDVWIVVPHQRQLTGRVVMENDGPRPRLFFTLYGEKGVIIGLNPEYFADGSFKMMAADGEYKVTLGAYPTSYDVKSIMAGSTNVLKEKLKIDGKNSPDIVVTMHSRKLVTVKGRVVNPPKLGLGAAPRVLLGGPALALDSTIKPDGSFEIRGVPAGEYSAWIIPGAPAASSIRVLVGDKDIKDLRILIRP